MSTIVLIAGMLFVLGVSFIAFQGGSVLGGLYEDLGLGDLGFQAQTWLVDHLGAVPDALWIVLVGVVLLGFWLRRRPRHAALSPRRRLPGRRVPPGLQSHHLTDNPPGRLKR